MTPRILVVDDDSLIRRIMHDTLATLPATVMEAKEGDEALKLAKAERPDLIFLDTMMPGMDGFQIAEILKQDPKTAGIPLVFVSALGTSSHKIRGLDIGAEDYLSKPIDPEELKARVRSILRRTRPPAPTAPEPAVPAGASGQLQAMPLPTLIRWQQMERRNMRLLLSRPGEEGEITFVNGEITRATQGSRRGEAAVYQLLTWHEGTFNLSPPLEGSPLEGGEVTRPNEDLLREGARRLEELPGLRIGLPGPGVLLEVPAALRSGIQQEVSPPCAVLVGLLDGTRDLDGILSVSPLDVWMTLRILQRLLRTGALGWNAGPPGSGAAPRRSVPRRSAETPIQYQSLRALQESGRFTLSARGVFIQTPTPFEVGERLVLRFQLPGEVSWITLIARVIWRNADAQRSRPEELGMGLQFEEVAAASLEAIEQRLTQAIVVEIREAVEKSSA